MYLIASIKTMIVKSQAIGMGWPDVRLTQQHVALNHLIRAGNASEREEHVRLSDRVGTLVTPSMCTIPEFDSEYQPERGRHRDGLTHIPRRNPRSLCRLQAIRVGEDADCENEDGDASQQGTHGASRHADPLAGGQTNACRHD
jgi:hypothetical protein